MNRKFLRERGITRRELAKAGLSGAAALCALGGIPAHSVFGRIAHAVAPPRELENRILVVFEMSGGNDGLNTVVPYGDDAYYRPSPDDRAQARRAAQARRPFRAQSGHGRVRAAVAGGPARHRPWLRLRQPVVLALHLDGVLAHRGAQQRRRIRLGRAARGRACSPAARLHFIVNVGDTQSLAVRSARSRAGGVRRPGEVRARGLLRGAGAVRARCRRPRRRQSRAPVPARHRAERARCVRPGARGVRRLPHADRLRPGAARSAQDRGADRGRRAGAPLLHVVSRQRVRHARAAEQPASAAAHLHRRCDRRVHDRSGAHRARRRRDRAGVLGVRAARAREHEPGHRPRHGGPDVRDRQAGQGRPLRRRCRA